MLSIIKKKNALNLLRMFKKLWHLFGALVVVPLVPMLKGHLIKQQCWYQSWTLLNHTITSSFLGFGWPSALGSSNGEEITKGAWLSKLLGIVYYSMPYHFWSLQLIFIKLQGEKRICLCQYERISFQYLFIYLFICLFIYCLFIYSHLFKQHYYLSFYTTLEKGVHVDIFENPVFYVRHNVFSRKML